MCVIFEASKEVLFQTQLLTCEEIMCSIADKEMRHL